MSADKDCTHGRVTYVQQEDFLDDEIIWQARCEDCGKIGDWEDSRDAALRALHSPPVPATKER